VNSGATVVGVDLLYQGEFLSTNLDGYVIDDKYKLRTGDKVNFQILEDHDLPKRLKVTDSGELDVPFIGQIAAAEKTCKQLCGEVRVLLEKITIAGPRWWLVWMVSHCGAPRA